MLSEQQLKQLKSTLLLNGDNAHSRGEEALDAAMREDGGMCKLADAAAAAAAAP